MVPALLLFDQCGHFYADGMSVLFAVIATGNARMFGDNKHFKACFCKCGNGFKILADRGCHSQQIDVGNQSFFGLMTPSRSNKMNGFSWLRSLKKYLNDES